MVVDESNVAALVAGLSTVLYGHEDDIAPIVDRLKEAVHEHIDAISPTVSAPVMRLLQSAEVVLPDEPGWQTEWPELARIIGEVDDGLGTASDAMGAPVDRIVGHVDAAISDLVPGTNDLIGGVLKALADFIGGFFGSLSEADDLWEALYSKVREGFAGDRDPLTAFIQDAVVAAMQHAADTWNLPSDVQDKIDAARPEHGAFRPKTVEQWIDESRNMPRFIQAIANVVTLLVDANAIIAARGTGMISGIVQASLAESQTSPLTVSQLASLLRRGDVGEDWARDEAKRTGYSDEIFGLVSKLTQSYLTSTDYVEMWRRTGDDSELDNLHKLGLSDDDISRLRTLALAIPTPSDLVRFMVRDAFDPGAIASGRLDDEFDKKVNDDWNRRVGVDKDTLRLFWMSHWTLPSPTMYYAMFHRGFITEQQLIDALKVSDFAPGWIDNLVKINYNVPGRIDVRRMYESGVITTHDELVRRHKDMGYSPEDAETLSVFVEKLDAKQRESDAERLYGPIVAEVIRSYAHGGVGYQEALDDLVGLGLSSDLATYRLQVGLFQRERDHDDRVRSAISREYIRGYISEADARSKLEGYGFEQTEQDSLLDSWNIDRDLQGMTEEKRHQRDLSKSEIVAAFADRILARSEAESQLVRMGYDAQESSTIIALEESKQARADAKAVESAVRSEYVTRRIEATEAVNTLQGFGYSQDRISALMLRWGVDREERRPDISASQVERMLMQGIIGKDDVLALLKRRGYADDDAAMLMTLYGTDVSIAQDQLEEKRREFEISESRRKSQGDRRLDLTERGQNLATDRFTSQQSGIQQRFEAQQSQQRTLQQARLDASTVSMNARVASQTARDAAQFERQRTLQANALQASADRLSAQIEATNQRHADSLTEQQAARQQRADLQAQASAAADTRQQRTLDAQAARLDRTIAAATARTEAAQAERQRLADQHAATQSALQEARQHAQEARDIRQNAERIAGQARAEQVRIRTENRAQARKDITTSDATAAASALQSLQLQQTAAVADITSRFATLTAQLADQRRQDALAARLAASQALASATPATVLLDSNV